MRSVAEIPHLKANKKQKWKISSWYPYIYYGIGLSIIMWPFQLLFDAKQWIIYDLYWFLLSVRLFSNEPAPMIKPQVVRYIHTWSPSRAISDWYYGSESRRDRHERHLPQLLHYTRLTTSDEKYEKQQSCYKNAHGIPDASVIDRLWQRQYHPQVKTCSGLTFLQLARLLKISRYPWQMKMTFSYQFCKQVILGNSKRSLTNLFKKGLSVWFSPSGYQYKVVYNDEQNIFNLTLIHRLSN